MATVRATATVGNGSNTTTAVAVGSRAERLGGDPSSSWQRLHNDVDSGDGDNDGNCGGSGKNDGG